MQHADDDILLEEVQVIMSYWKNMWRNQQVHLLHSHTQTQSARQLKHAMQ
jgi:hypothetical protein